MRDDVDWFLGLEMDCKARLKLEIPKTKSRDFNIVLKEYAVQDIYQDRLSDLGLGKTFGFPYHLAKGVFSDLFLNPMIKLNQTSEDRLIVSQ